MQIIILLILPAIIYKVVRDAAREGTYNALIEYEKYKKEEVKGS